MGDSFGGKSDDSGVIGLIGKIMLVVVFVLFLVVVIIFFLHLYAKWFWHRRQQDSANNNTTTTNTRRRRRRFDFAPGYQELNVVTALRRGLDPAVLRTIPVVVFSANDFKDGLECAVCLSEVSEGEKARLLPKCNHGFHLECIDMWFESHSTCPLCRNPISTQSSLSSTSPELTTLESILQAPNQENAGVNGYSTESPNFPTNVLFWGDETQVSTMGPCLEEGHQGLNSALPPCTSSSSSSSSLSSLTVSTSNRPDGVLVIDIPSHANEDDEQKSPMPTRLRSLKRLLSRDRRVSPRSDIDIAVDQHVGRVDN